MRIEGKFLVSDYFVENFHIIFIGYVSIMSQTFSETHPNGVLTLYRIAVEHHMLSIICFGLSALLNPTIFYVFRYAYYGQWTDEDKLQVNFTSSSYVVLWNHEVKGSDLKMTSDILGWRFLDEERGERLELIQQFGKYGFDLEEG